MGICPLDERLGAVDACPLSRDAAEVDPPTMRKTQRFKRLALTTAVAALGIGVGAPAANASLLVADAPDCTPPAVTQAFAQFNDSSNYMLMPGGTFEDGAPGWSLSRASIGSGSESFHAHGAGDSHSLTISAGGVATSPTVCAGLEHPTMRFFSKSSGLLPLASVSVLAKTSLGLVVEVPIGLISPGSQWHATSKYLVIANLLPLLPNNYTPLAFRFRAVTGTWTIDDVYVDPMRRS
jgi:hypothetical protein